MEAFFSYVAALASACLAGMGVGGGGLLVIYLSAIAGVAQYKAQGINLLFFVFSSASALAIHIKNKRIIRSAALISGISALPAALLGSRVALHAGSSTLRVMFGIMLIVSGLLVLLPAVIRFFKRKKRAGQNTSE